MNQLDALKQFTTVVADTGDFRQLAQFLPQDATTNPSLILKAVQKSDYAPLMNDTVAQWHGRDLAEVMDRLLVRFGCDHSGPCLNRSRRAPVVRHQRHHHAC